MIQTRMNSGSLHATTSGGCRAIATSLFGGAILATVATASFAQFPMGSLSNFGGTSVTSGEYVVANGYSVAGDGGGGIFMPGGTVCTQDSGIVFVDMSGTCFYRADPTFSVREWGAVCNVVAVNPPGGTLTANWDPGTPGSTMGTLTVATTLLSAPPLTGENIAISQIGNPTLFGSSMPAVSLTRFSTITGAAQVGYKAGDLISFAGGTFSQQAAIIVDAVVGNGTISQWHFLWGGLYQPGTALPTGPMTQDNTHSYCGLRSNTLIPCGTLNVATGATLTPAWSGWSVLNSQSISNPGTGYAVGDIVTLVGAGNVVNGTHSPTLIVESTTSSVSGVTTITGEVATYDWLDYGSIGTLVTTGTLSDQTSLVGPNPSGLVFGPVAWTQAPYASTIAGAGTIGGGMTTILVAGTAAFPGTISVQSFYYGDDDSVGINRALQAMPTSALIIPAGCGTTHRLNMSQDASANNANPSLVGSNLESSGLYAFAVPLANRGTVAVLSSVLYGGLVDFNNSGVPRLNLASGGGFRNMLIEGFGIPEGFGYWGLAESISAPPGYVGPAYVPSQLTDIPYAGTAVELDKVALMRIDNVHVTDGGIGPGNSDFQCSLDESDPSNFLNADVGNIVFTDSRMDTNPLFAGPGNADFALRIGDNCHDSVYRNLTAFDGITADVLLYNGNMFGQIHLGSSAVNAGASNGALPALNWSTVANFGIANFGLAGAANYGVYGLENTSLTQTHCDIADIACVFLSVDYKLATTNPAQITDTQIGCGGFTNVPVGYAGVQVSASTIGTTVSGTAAAGKCGMAPSQVVYLFQGGPLDPTSSLCNNSNVPIAACTGYQGGYASSQNYTQPAQNYGTVALSANTLYAVPFYSPAGGGTITQLGLQVSAHGTAGAQCNLGIYNAFAGRPTSSIFNAGTVNVNANGATMMSSGTVQLAPATLYFLAVGCNGTVSVDGVATTGAATVPLTGSPDFVTTTSELSAGWTYSSGSLPAMFPTLTVTASGSVPNVYAGP